MDRTDGPIVAWNRATDQSKYGLSNAPPHTALDLPLRVAFRRFKIEHVFRLAQGEVGLSHFEGRSYVGRMRPRILGQTACGCLWPSRPSGRLRQVRSNRPAQASRARQGRLIVCAGQWSRVGGKKSRVGWPPTCEVSGEG